jgi:hypothetical protein
MAFAGDLRAFSIRLSGRARATYDGVVAETWTSLVNGSPLTGSPGQPVGETGDMRASWFKQLAGPWVTEMLTHDPGARTIEGGRRLGRRLHRRVTQGGFHSLKLTMIHFGRILSSVVRQVAGSG